MNIQQLDEKLVSEPLSKEQRVQLINTFLNAVYLQGIDKGTALECSRVDRIRSLKEKRNNKRFNDFMDNVDDLINIYEKRAYREKYKGRYSYYVPKKPIKKKERPATYKQRPIW